MRILLVEDDVMIGESIQAALNGDEIEVDWVKDGRNVEWRLTATHSYDALLLDLGLPYTDGMDILRNLRQKKNNVPVLVVTARDTVAQKVLGLDNGADDCLVKPFDLDELIARLRALVRRSRGNEHVYCNGDVTVHIATRQVFVAQQQVILSSREWALLEALIIRPGAILSKSQLEDRIYGFSSDVESNAIEVHIHGLRKKLGASFVVNVRGIGYRVEKT